MDALIKEAILRGVAWVAEVHDKLCGLNDGLEKSLTDKQMHFLVMGAGGLAVFFAAWVLFRAMARRGVGGVAWLFSFVLVVAIAFAVEVGQGLTGTGNMDINDTIYGVMGFLAFSVVFAVARLLLRRRR